MRNIFKRGQNTTHSVEGTLTRVNIESDEKISELRKEIEKLRTEIERVKSEMDKQTLKQRINEEAFKELTHKLELAIVERDEQLSNHRKVEDELNSLKSELKRITTEWHEQTNVHKSNEETAKELKYKFEQVVTDRNTLTIEKLKYEEENTKLKNQLQISDIQKERLKNDLQELHTARDALQTNFHAKTKEEVKLRTALNDAQKATQELLKQLQKSDSEKEKLKLNLQELQKERYASQLKNEPNNDAKPKNDTAYLVTQSDGNRPDTCKVAEKFGELYVNEWADCYEVLKSEESVCQTLMAICVNIYSTYVKAIEKNALIKAEMELDNDLKGFIKVLRGGKTSNAICLYWNKCKDICRQMIANDPPIYMDIDTDKHGHRFNDTLYQYYTVRGPRIDYIVWPALYRGQNDKMLCKGHAQGAN